MGLSSQHQFNVVNNPSANLTPRLSDVKKRRDSEKLPVDLQSRKEIFWRISVRLGWAQWARQGGDCVPNTPGAQVVFLWDMSTVIGKGLRERETGESACTTVLMQEVKPSHRPREHLVLEATQTVTCGNTVAVPQKQEDGWCYYIRQQEMETNQTENLNTQWPPSPPPWMDCKFNLYMW